MIFLFQGIVSFTKYLSAGAPADRIDFVLRFTVDEEIMSLQREFSSVSSEEEEGEDGEEQGSEAARPEKKAKY